MATVSGKIFQVKDGTTNLFPRTVIEAVYGLDKTIADVKTWVGNNYVALATVQTITGAKYFNNNAFVLAGGEAGDTTNQRWDNGTYYNFDDTALVSSLSGLRNAIRFRWYDNYYDIGVVRGSGMDDLGFAIGKENADHTHVLDYFRINGTNAYVHGAAVYHTGNFNPANYLTTSAAASTYAKLSTWNNLIHSSNEFTFVPAEYIGSINLNYRTASGATDGNISSYHFRNGAGGYAGVTASKFVVYGGTSAQFLKADGSVDSNTYLTTSSAASTYLPLKAQGATVYRTTSGQIANFNNSKGANEEAYLTLQSNSTSKAAVGWNSTYGTYIYNYPSAKYLGIKDDGTPHYQGNTLYHAGNANLNTVDWMALTLTANKLRITTKHNSSSKAGGIYYYDGTTDYLLIGQGSSNLWIGANETSGTHHTGSTYISTGGSESLFVSKLVGGTRTNTVILDAFNYYTYPAHSLRDYNYHDVSHRRTAGNVTFADGGLHYFLTTSSMTDAGRPGHDGHILHYAWDNGTWDTQMFIPDGGITTDDNAHVKVRGQNGLGSWDTWHTLYDDVNLNKSKIINIMGGTFPEAYLGWGGRNLTSSQIGPMDAALCDELGANRLAFAKAAGIDITYSNDGGSTWTDYDASDAAKLALTSSGTGLIIGKSSSSSPATTNSRLKVVFNTAACGVYTNLDKFIMRVSTSGSTSCWVSIRVRTQTNVEAGTDTWTTLANKVPIDGWSGYDVINVMKFTTYGSGSSKSHQGQIELIFGADGAANSAYYGLQVYSIYAYGGMGWTTPSTMAKTGHLYSYDYNQTAYFPNDVHPAVSGKYLGSSSNRWSLYATDGNFSDMVSCSSIRTAYLADSSLAQYIIGSASNVLGSGYKGLALKSYGSESIYLFTGGSQRMVINSSGNIGIGADASSSHKLYVTGGTSYFNGSIAVAGNITSTGKVIVGAGGPNGSAVGSDDASNIYLANSAGAPLVADGLVVRRGVAATNGQLGNATYRWANIYSVNGDFSGSVSVAKSVSSTSWVTDSCQFIAGATGTNYRLGMAATTNGYGVIQAANKGIGAIPLLLNPSGGNVGIGTTSPSVPLQVNGIIKTYNESNYYGIAVGEGSNSIEGLYSSGYGAMHLNYFSSGGVSICNGGGCLTVGGTVQSGYKLYVNGTANITTTATVSGGVEIGHSNEINGVQSGAYTQDIHLNYRSTGYVSLGYGGGNVGVGKLSPSYKLDVLGVIHSTTGIFSDGYVSALGTASSSDAKLKDDITTISYNRAKEVLSSLNPSEWTWNALTSKEGERGAGMVAQEVIPILPDTVKEIGGNLTLEYNTLFAYGLAATKYMLPMVETHEEKIARLEKEVEELKRQLTN